MISVVKTINFYIKWFHIIRKIKIKCFLFTLKVPEKTYLSLRRFFILDCLRILRLFFVFLKVLIGLTRFQRCFLNVLGQKTSLKWILEWQKQKLCFYSHHNDSKWEIIDDTLFFFFCQNIRWIIKFQIVILRLLKKISHLIHVRKPIIFEAHTLDQLSIGCFWDHNRTLCLFLQF
jgi:hypothetical protein